MPGGGGLMRILRGLPRRAGTMPGRPPGGPRPFEAWPKRREGADVIPNPDAPRAGPRVYEGGVPRGPYPDMIPRDGGGGIRAAGILEDQFGPEVPREEALDEIRRNAQARGRRAPMPVYPKLEDYFGPEVPAREALDELLLNARALGDPQETRLRLAIQAIDELDAERAMRNLAPLSDDEIAAMLSRLPGWIGD